MIKIRTYNTKLTEIEGWPTEDKVASVEIIDEDNHFAFCIEFGSKPIIQVYNNSSEENFGEKVLEYKL